MEQKQDKWELAGSYENYVGRWSRIVAPQFLKWLNIPSDARWLDVGCGTGVLSQAILNLAHPNEVKGIDPSEGFINFARENVIDERVSFEVGDAQQLPVESGTYDTVVAGLVLNFIADKPKAASEMARAAKPNGVVAAYVWDYADQMQMMRYFWDSVIELHPDARDLDQGRRFPICKPEPLTELFQNAGLSRVEVHNIDTPTHFRDFDDYWTPFLGKQGPAPAYLASLDEGQRDEIRDAIHSRLPINADGLIHLIARAWAVRGYRVR